MDAVTDIFAFAAEHADYWTEFLSGADYSAVLSSDEMKALEAARVHVEEGIYYLLLECGVKLAAKLTAQGIVTRSFQRGATAKNRKVRIDPPVAWKDRLYGLEFEFSADDKNERILLYGSLVVKKGSSDKLAAKLAQKAVSFTPDGYHIYGEGVPLEKGKAFDVLADQVTGGLTELFLAAV
jgi:hypothetical protein